ncbi:RNA methyltransferase [Halorutilales archaeon Cl-col2-1]
MPKLSVVLVDPETPGNVGTAARAVKNFGFDELLVVDPPGIEEGDEAYGFAQDADDVLRSRRSVGFDEVVESYYTVGFTATTGSPKQHARFPYTTPEEIRYEIEDLDAKVALVFGRESTGLTNEEIGRLDRVCSIPANPEYPSLNLGQAVTVALYEMRKSQEDDNDNERQKQRHDRADDEYIERFHTVFGDLLAAVDHPEGRREKTARMMRRVLGRCHPTKREITTLIGTVNEASETIKHLRKRKQCDCNKDENESDE